MARRRHRLALAVVAAVVALYFLLSEKPALGAVAPVERAVAPVSAFPSVDVDGPPPAQQFQSSTPPTPPTPTPTLTPTATSTPPLAVPVIVAAGTVSTVVDGVRGLGVTSPWVPARRVVSLPLGSGQGSVHAIVDNWWARHHLGGKALAWGAGSEDSKSFFGVLRPVEGAAPEAHAPPLPVCAPTALGSGAFSHPLAAAGVQGFKDFSTASFAHAGSDERGYTASMGEGGRTAGGAVEPGHVRALVWHRVAYAETTRDTEWSPDVLAGAGNEGVWGAFMHNATVRTPQGRAQAFASITNASRVRFCAGGGGGLSPDFAPNPRCGGAPAPAPPVSYPYLNRATAPVVVVSLDCGYAESGGSHEVIIWNVQTLDGGGHVVTHNMRRWSALLDVPLADYDELGCAGTTVYPDAAGHFFNELLPRLVHLDLVLPLHVPLLWPPGALPKRVLKDLVAGGFLSRERTFVPTPQGRSMHRARRLYVYSSDYGAGHTPLLTFTSQRLFAGRLHAHARAAGAASPPHDGIVVLERAPGSDRAVANLAELLAALRAALPGVHVESFLPGAAGFSFLEAAVRIHGARVIIGPHGANLNNILAARPGAWVVEMGYADRGNPLPSDYFGLSRNLGLRYWLSMSDSGAYGGPLVAAVADVVDIARRAYAPGSPGPAQD